MRLLTVSVSVSESYALVGVAGEADMTVSGKLREPLMAAVLAGARDLVVDVSGLSFIDAGCVRVLVRVCGMAEDAGGTLGLVAPQPVVVRMLELCGADQLFAVYGSVTEAASRRVLRTGGKWPCQARAVATNIRPQLGKRVRQRWFAARPAGSGGSG